jgi:hypothetical protein
MSRFSNSRRLQRAGRGSVVVIALPLVSSGILRITSGVAPEVGDAEAQPLRMQPEIRHAMVPKLAGWLFQPAKPRRNGEFYWNPQRP